MNDLRDLVVNGSHHVGQSVTDADHPIIYNKNLFCNSPYPFVYSMRGPQVFRNGHPSFLMRKLVESLQRIFHIRPPDQPLPILFWTFFQSRETHKLNYLLIRLCFISLVAIPRMVRISTI